MLKDLTKQNSTTGFKNKSQKFAVRNFSFVIVFIFLIMLGVGLFGQAGKVEAEDPGICTVVNQRSWPMTRSECVDKSNEVTVKPFKVTWENTATKAVETIKEASVAETTASEGTCSNTAAKTPEDCAQAGGQWTLTPKNISSKNPLEESLKACGPIDGWTMDGCIQKVFFVLFYNIPTFLLSISANFFNTILGLTMKGKLLESNFVSSAWGIVRDLSNIFFILILLYIAVKIILDLGGHEAKQMIVKVVVIALLINFSMFFTKVVIDSSNVLALIFYNKLDVTTKINGTLNNYIPSTPQNEKDLSGAMVSAFDVTKFMSQGFFDMLKEKTQVFAAPSKTQILGAVAFPPYGAYVSYNSLKNWLWPTEEIPMGIILSIIVIAGTIMLFATYAFLVAGLSFLARLIELWVLIIFSPFAFMSFTIPELKKTDYIGWDAWLNRLLTTSFMAPIFLFFMYFIFMLLNSNIFTDMIVPEAPRTVVANILFLVLPALFILILLLQATKFAKKGAGTIGEAVVTGAKVLGGLAIGATGLGLANTGRMTLGAFMKGASTGDTSARRLIAERTSGIRDTNLGAFGRIKGNLQIGFGIDKLQQKIQPRLNRDQHDVEHAAHARHDLDTEAAVVAPGKKWEQLNGEQRDIVKTNISRKDAMRDLGYGNKTWGQITDAEKTAVTSRLAVAGNAHSAVAETLINAARRKQSLRSTILQSTVTGTYDARNLANIVAKEQSTGFAKIAMGLTGAIAMGMRGGFNKMGVNYGTAQGAFFKDLGNTLTEALKNAKINIDLSHVGEVKKEDSHGGGGHH